MSWGNLGETNLTRDHNNYVDVFINTTGFRTLVALAFECSKSEDITVTLMDKDQREKKEDNKPVQAVVRCGHGAVLFSLDREERVRAMISSALPGKVRIAVQTI